MEQLDLLWKYQELDILHDQYDQDKKNSPLRQKLLKLRNYLIDQDKYLVDLDDEAERKNKALQKVQSECENILHAINAGKDRLNSGQVKSVDEIEQMAKEGLELKDRIVKKEAELKKLVEDLEKFKENLENIRVKVNKAKREYANLKKDYDEETQEIKRNQEKVKQQLDELAKEIDSSLLVKYKNIKSGRTPAISMLVDNQCSGCYMSLASLVVQNVKDKKKIVECENCGRLLYFKG